MVVPPADQSAATPTVPCPPGYPARVSPVTPVPVCPGAVALPPDCPGDTAPALGCPEDSVPELARSASISFARPVSIITAPAPTVTMTAAGTPILATCHPSLREPAS